MPKLDGTNGLHSRRSSGAASTFLALFNFFEATYPLSMKNKKHAMPADSPFVKRASRTLLHRGETFPELEPKLL